MLLTFLVISTWKRNVKIKSKMQVYYKLSYSNWGLLSGIRKNLPSWAPALQLNENGYE